MNRSYLVFLVGLMLAGSTPVVRAEANSMVQFEAPSANSASPAWLDRADFPEFAGIALAWPLRAEPTPALTLSSNAGAIGSMWRRRSSFASGWGRYGALARVGLSATIGGPTPEREIDWFSRSQGETKHLTAGLKLRLLGSEPPYGSPGPAPLVANPSLRVSLDIVADTYATGFGRDLYAGTLIVESRAFIGNVGVRQEERPHHSRRHRELKIATGREWRIAGPSPARVPLRLTVALGGIIRDDARESVPAANARIDCLVARAFRLTASGLVSSDPERAGQTATRGIIGISYGR